MGKRKGFQQERYLSRQSNGRVGHMRAIRRWVQRDSVDDVGANEGKARVAGSASCTRERIAVEESLVVRAEGNRLMPKTTVCDSHLSLHGREREGTE